MSTNSHATPHAPSCSSAFAHRWDKSEKNIKIRDIIWNVGFLAKVASSGSHLSKQNDQNDDCLVVFCIHTHMNLSQWHSHIEWKQGELRRMGLLFKNTKQPPLPGSFNWKPVHIGTQCALVRHLPRFIRGPIGINHRETDMRQDCQALQRFTRFYLCLRCNLQFTC